VGRAHFLAESTSVPRLERRSRPQIENLSRFPAETKEFAALSLRNSNFRFYNSREPETHLLSSETGSTIATTTGLGGRTAECQAEILNGPDGNALPRVGIEE
jgi:hypothetical protein